MYMLIRSSSVSFRLNEKFECLKIYYENGDIVHCKKKKKKKLLITYR